MATTARLGTVAAVGTALNVVASASSTLDSARAAVVAAELALELAQRRVSYALRIFRSELELRVADVATYVGAQGTTERQRLYLVQLEDGDVFSLAAATSVRDYLLSVQTARLTP
ncbi:MAG: hypothetical protein M3P26_16605 [Gemmatimonadota bacterium]|nr:hypothetical protein [Gemmatimonadota bacterium]